MLLDRFLNSNSIVMFNHGPESKRLVQNVETRFGRGENTERINGIRFKGVDIIIRSRNGKKLKFSTNL